MQKGSTKRFKKIQQKGKFKKSKKAKIKKVDFSVIDECRTQAAPGSIKQAAPISSKDVQ